MNQILLKSELGKYKTNRRYDEIVKICLAYLDEGIDEYYVYSELAHGYNMLKEFYKALDALNEAITLEPEQLHLYFSQGRIQTKLLLFDDAIESMSAILPIEEKHQWFYYTDTAYMWRAIAYYKKIEYQKALDDLAKIPDRLGTYVFGEMIDKPDLEGRCRAALTEM